MESTGGRYVTIPRGALSRLLVEKITGSAEIILEDENPHLAGMRGLRRGGIGANSMFAADGLPLGSPS